jgi:DNA-binding LytR/AlgR family response regulator
MKCIIAEDEPIAREILRSYIEKTPGLRLMAQFENAITTFEYMKSHAADILFLDIKMPQLTGLELLQRLVNKPKTIITSAYRYYATDAFDLEVVDYLLKPYSYERFSRALTKAGMETGADTARPHVEKPYFFVKENKQLHKVPFDDIIFLESQRDYIRFHIADQEDVTTRNTISYYEEFLPSNKFIRIHRSFIVSVKHITSLNAATVSLGSLELPIGRNYKSTIIDRIKSIPGGS